VWLAKFSSGYIMAGLRGWAGGIRLRSQTAMVWLASANRWIKKRGFCACEWSGANMSNGSE